MKLPPSVKALLGRTEPQKETVQLVRRRVYILPTRNGVIFAVILLTMLIGAINYNNSLAYALTFLLAGLVIVSMVHSFRNINALCFHKGHVLAVYTGQRARYPVEIDNPSPFHRLNIQLILPNIDHRSVDVPPKSKHWIEMTVPLNKRGLHPLGRLTIESRYPLGLFRTWAYVHLDYTALAYPKPAKRSSIPPEALSTAGSIGDKGKGTDDFSKLRPYQNGDSLKHVDWKAYARGQIMLTKQFGGEERNKIWLDFDSLGGLDLETRLSFLTRMAMDAHHEGASFGLRLPSQNFEPAHSDQHLHQCLKALALFGS